MLRLSLVVWIWLFGLLGALQAQLVAGDIAVIAYNMDNDDEFAWVALTDIAANTVINFTDSSVASGDFRWGEHLSALQGGPLVWSHAAEVFRGTVIRYDAQAPGWTIGTASNTAPNLSASGDQLIAYTGVITNNPALSGNFTGDPAAAIVIYALNAGNSGWTNADATIYSEVPDGVSTSANTAIHIDSRDNGYYSGIRTGSVDQLLKAISDPASWSTSDQRIDSVNWPQAFEILPETLLIEFSWIPSLTRTSS